MVMYNTNSDWYFARAKKNVYPVYRTGCLIWMGRVSTHWYGQIGDANTKTREQAHRYFYRKVNGPIPAGMFICHRCDNPQCVNPEHLFLGTGNDNIQDMREKGRAAIGVRHGGARLTETDVLAIRASAETDTQVAARYGMKRSSINEIRLRKKWKHIPPQEIN